MCGRYAMSMSYNQVQQAVENYGLPVTEVRNSEDSHPSHNIGPTKSAATYRNTVDGNNVIQYMSWGLIPVWQKRKADASQFKTFNARKESIIDGSKMWLPVRKHKRIVVPIEGYYEWKHKQIGNSKKVDKIPYYIRRKDKKLMFLAGMYGSVQFEGSKEKYYTFTIITGPAPEQLKWLHERMPIVLTPGTKEWESWLSEKEWNDEIADCLKVYNNTDLEWFEVTRDVGKITNDGKYLTKPLKKSGIQAFFSAKKETKTDKDKEIKIGDGFESRNDIKEEPDTKRKFETIAGRIHDEMHHNQNKKIKK